MTDRNERLLAHRALRHRARLDAELRTVKAADAKTRGAENPRPPARTPADRSLPRDRRTGRRSVVRGPFKILQVLSPEDRLMVKCARL